ncbi:MAG: hypothetical protein ABIQ31_04755 [Ferruginibacter sp.]
MKTNIQTYRIKIFVSSTCQSARTAGLSFLKQIIYSAAFLLFSFSVAAQADPISVTSSSGTTGPVTYPTLKLAVDAINGGIHQGIISIDIIGNTIETVSVSLNASGSGASNYSAINIQPGGGARTISGSIAAPLLDLNGADNVTIDGLNKGGNSLTISNASATAGTSTIRFISDATANTIQNCTLAGSGTSSNAGTILFSTGSAAGNSNNNITSNKIGQAGSDLPLTAIYSEGTAANPNVNNVILNNNIYNYLLKGIDISSTGSGAWTVSGNSFYKEVSVYDNYSSISSIHAIRILGGSGYNILNNFIGGEGNQLSGNNAVYNSSVLLEFTGILLSTGSATPVSYIKGNKIAKIKFSTSSLGNFYGIETAGSGITLGGTASGEGNTLGSNTSNGSITISTANAVSKTASLIYGIYFHSSGGLIIGNQVAGIDITDQGFSQASTEFRAIYVTIPSPPSQVNNNVIGSTTTTNSIRIMAASTASTINITGIYLGSTISSALAQVNGNIIQNISHLSSVSSATFNGINAQNGYVQSYQDNIIKNIYAAANSSNNSGIYTGIQSSTSLNPSTVIINNTIDNINYQSSGINAQVRGMQISGGSPKVTIISGNTISNLTALSQKTANADTDDPTAFTILGIWFVTGGTSSVISNNNFYNFSSLTMANVNTVVAGLGILSTGGGDIYGNRISGFTNSANGSSSLPAIIGIKAFKGSFNVYNNSIKISNGSLTNGVNIYGIAQNTSNTAWNYFHNSIAISGNTSAGSATRTAAFIRTTDGGLQLKNNVFVNTRTGTGANYAISNIVAPPATTWTSSSSNYNNLYSSNTNTTAEWGNGTGNSLSQFQISSGGEANSVNRSVSFIASDYDLQNDANSNCALNNSGIPIASPVINTDLNGTARSVTNPDLGAYEFAYNTPVHTASNNGPKCTGGNASLNVATGTGIAPFSYGWTGPASFISTSQNPAVNNLAAPMTGVYTVTVTDVNGCAADAPTTLTINASPAGAISSDAGTTAATGRPVIFTATDGISYNFTVNGSSIQSNSSATYTTSGLKTGDIVAVTVSNSNGCSATYAGITMSVAGIMVNGKNYTRWNKTTIKTWNGIKKVN